MYNTKKTQDAQNDVLIGGIQKQKQRQGEVNKTTQDLLSKFASSNPEGDKAKALAQYTQQLGKNKGQSTAGLTKVAGASEEYGEATADAALGINDYGALISDLMSRIDAPESQRRREGVMMGDYGVELDRTKRASAGDDYLMRLKLQTKKRNPWLDAISSALAGYGAGGSGGGIASIFGGGNTGLATAGHEGGHF